MKNIVFLFLFLISLYLSAQPDAKIERSYFNLTTSNGLIVAVFDANKNSVEYVFPHIFANYDSALYVRPFAGNIKLISSELPAKTSYLKNTHVISINYTDFTVNYFASFTKQDKIFYIVIRGEKEKIRDLSFNLESGQDKILTGISLLTNSHEDLTVKLAGKLFTGTIMRPYKENLFEKYFLYSFKDSLHTDTSLVSKALLKISEAKESLVDQEVRFMQNLFTECKIPDQISAKEKNIVEQSISFFKMSQVSDKEIFPLSHGQVLAALRPGLWHVSWVRDGSYAIQAMTHLGMYAEARKALEFMLKARSGQYVYYVHKDGKDYGIGSDYQISVCRYFGNGREESTYGDGPNIQFDNFGLFLWAFSDYISVSGDTSFFSKWEDVVRTKVADVTISCIDTNSLMREDSGPWEHYLQMPKQYTFTSGVCAKGLENYSILRKKLNLPYQKYASAAKRLKDGILTNMLIDGRYFKGNANNKQKSDYEYYDAGVYEVFVNKLIEDKKLFLSHMDEYDQVLRLKGERAGYIRLSSNDPYENQEWVFINLRIALAHLLFGQKPEASELFNYVTEQASLNFNTIPEMYSNKVQSEKVTEYFKSHDIWCNCIRDKDGLYIGAIPMVGYGSGAYVLTLLSYYAK